MDIEIKNGFAELKNELTAFKNAVDNRLGRIETTMATKDEIAKLATKDELNQLRLDMNDQFASQHSETRAIQEKLLIMDGKIDRLFRTESEDIEAVAMDLERVKRQLVLAGTGK